MSDQDYPANQDFLGDYIQREREEARKSSKYLHMLTTQKYTIIDGALWVDEPGKSRRLATKEETDFAIGQLTEKAAR